MILTDKLLRFQLYYQEMLAIMNFRLKKMFYQKKDQLEKAAAIKRFENYLLDKELKKQTSVAEEHYQKLNNGF